MLACNRSNYLEWQYLLVLCTPMLGIANPITYNWTLLTHSQILYILLISTYPFPSSIFTSSHISVTSLYIPLTCKSWYPNYTKLSPQYNPPPPSFIYPYYRIYQNSLSFPYKYSLTYIFYWSFPPFIVQLPLPYLHPYHIYYNPCISLYYLSPPLNHKNWYQKYTSTSYLPVDNYPPPMPKPHLQPPPFYIYPHHLVSLDYFNLCIQGKNLDGRFYYYYTWYLVCRFNCNNFMVPSIRYHCLQ